VLLRATQPLPARSVGRWVPVDLTGSMTGYVWGMPVNGMGGVPVTVARGERVELAMRNVTLMAHPMHLHGHSFQVSEINGQRFSGAMRDFNPNAAEDDGEGHLRRQQSRPVGVSLPQSLSHGGRHVRDCRL
jgi:FtsP/CotA-like multicopper oxidase with cupredoxin domain